MSSASSACMFSLLLLVFITVFVGGSSNSFPFKDIFNNDILVRYEPVGCFKDDGNSRALRNHYYNFRTLIDWKKWPQITKDIVKECAKKAYEKGFTKLFGVQFYGECWSDGDAERRFALYGDSKNCVDGVGKSWTNQIYRFTRVIKSHSKQCNVNGKVYNVEETMYIPNDWSSNVHHAKCMECTCSPQGKPSDCQLHSICDVDLQGPQCSKYKNVTGECCPQCDCVHDGKVMSEGSEWVDKIKMGQHLLCRKCTCGRKGIATCDVRAVTCSCDGVVIPDPGQCCPKCVPKATTTKAPETLPPKTEQPPFSRPPRPVILV